MAARYGDASLTYAALDQRANGVAHHLVDHGVRPGDHVGLYVERSLDMLVGMLGILKAGGAYVPLDTTYPADRLAYMVQDAGVHCVLTQSHLPPLASVNPVALDQWQRSADHPPAVTIAPTDRAYVIYTSGSTGQPKGVAVTHRNVVRLVHPGSAARNDYPVVETDIVAQASNHAFDAATFEVWGALTQGAQLVGIRKDNLLDPVTLRQQLRDQHVSVLFVTTALFNQIAQAAPDSFAHVRVLRFGGEAVDNQWVRTILHHGRPAHLLHVYGPTENTTFSTAYEVTEAETASYPIGFPLAQSSVHVLDPWQQPVPQGSEGELYVGGDGVADGYWQRPELNAERFVRDPFSPDPGARLYRTGDLVRMRADGALVFVGRVDHQIKLRGFRIELGEIEQALLAQPGIRSAIVILREDSPGQKALCAYVVSDEHPSLDAATADALRTRLRDALQQDLPDYMVPAAIEPLAALPLTANGKIDRNALPVPTLSESAGADYQPPANAIEHQLVNLWAELLGRDPATLSVNANFFELGGDSILSIQLVSRALQQGLQLSVKQLFAHQTIRRLAPCVTQGQGIAIPQGPVTGAMPLLPIQRRFLQEAGDRQHFNQAVLLRVPADLDSAALQAVVHHWYQRHDALRLRFVQDADHHWSAEHQPLDDAMLAASWEQVDYRDADSVSRNAQTQQRAMNIHTGPLFKAIHYRPDDGAPDGYRLLLVAHHLIVDGVSWRILLDDAQQWLGQASRGQPLRPAAKTSAYQQWGEWLQDYVHSDAFQSQKAYWHQQISRLASADAQRLHAEQPRCQHGDAGHITLDWSAEHTRALLSQAGRAYRTQVNELLLSGLLLGLSRWSGCTQVLIDLEGHGRESRDERIDLTQTVGWFTSVYPLALSLPDGDNDDLGRLIQQVKQQYRAVPDHGIGYGLLRYLADDPVLADGPQAPVVFNYLGQFDQVVNDDGPFAGAPESRGDDVSPERAMSHALNFNGLVADGCLSFDLSYDPQQYSAETMAALADAVQHSVTALIQHCLDPESGAVSAADFPLVAMDDAVVRDWPHQLNCRPRDVEDLYPATPMQSGLLFHSLLVRSAYVTQLRLTFEGDLDTQAFRQAWHTLQQRHAIFRTAFVGEDHGQLHQAVLANAPVPWHSDNLRHLSAEAQNAHIEAYRDAEYEAGFNLHAAPLMAVALFQTLSAAGEPQTQLLWSHHHALSDGWCLGLIFSELQSAYRAALHGQAPALPPVTPYREYIAWWQRQDMAAARTYWQQVLADIDGPTPLPGGRVSVDDLAAPAVQHHLQLSAAASDRLSALARSTQTTVNTLLQAAWSYLLARYSGDDTVVFGTTVSGRPADLPGVESMVGLFINTLPVVVTVPNDSPIETWLQTLHQQQHARNTYSYIPLADLQRERGISPLFDSLLVFENYPVDRLREQRDEVDPAALRVVGSASVEATNYPLSITASLSDCLHVKLTYQPAQLSQAQVERLGQQLLRVLQQLDSATHVGELSLLSAAETQQALTALQGPTVAYPDTCLHTQFEAQVTRTPDAIAVVADDGELSYAQLNAQANQVARALRARGVSTQTLVGLCATRSCAMLVGLIGILKAGAAYVPIDPNYPPARQTHLLEDSGVNWVVTAGVSELASTEHQCQTLALDSDHIQAELLTLDTDNLNLSDINPRALAYVIYTSGSTGKPKGAQVYQYSFSNLCAWYATSLGEISRGNVLVFSSLSFDLTQKNLWTPLFKGGTLVLHEASFFDPKVINNTIAKHRIDYINCAPSAFYPLLEQCNAETEIASLKAVYLGGEPIAWARVRDWFLTSDCRLWNSYGPTECTDVVAAFEFDREDVLLSENTWNPPVGNALANIHLFVLDESLKPCPQGVAGDLYIGGECVGAGYFGNASLSREKFIPHPHSLRSNAEEKIYKTGDKAYWNESGGIYFIGRDDDQVKIRGYRISLSEIERHLGMLTAVKRAVVLAQNGSLAAYVVPENLNQNAEQKETLITQLLDELGTRLPEYMIPSRLMLLDAIPLSPNGKVDKKALPAIDTLSHLHELTPLTTDTQRKLAGIWAKVLSIPTDAIGANSHFLRLGGHSLLVVQLASEIRREFAIEIEISALFESAVLEHTAKQIDSIQLQHYLKQREAAVEIKSEGSL
ncbi:amino acid adenylation domain-containing protein [Teredinibacter turnerae]|uniref:amino acid adenylation domain-containing protein n=1 Tax=Teredinibacter turnerae TaxID=2426 RepID=UPI0030D0369A